VPLLDPSLSDLRNGVSLALPEFHTFTCWIQIMHTNLGQPCFLFNHCGLCEVLAPAPGPQGLDVELLVLKERRLEMSNERQRI